MWDKEIPSKTESYMTGVRDACRAYVTFISLTIRPRDDMHKTMKLLIMFETEW
jgi:hypothetical protein